MSVTRRRARCSAEDVFRVLSDGWSYAAWVVGAARVRAVSDDWPMEGATIHHSVGLWPVVLDDTTTVVACTPPHHLLLRGRAWPAGEADIDITVTDDEGDTAGCLITMREAAVRGPATLLPKPIENVSLHVRNIETLKRLVPLAERRARPDES